jgi:hypothetical protein
MKTTLIFIACIVQLCLSAQDTIYKRAGGVIPAKILEIGIKDISYKRTDISDGPLFIINKNEIHKIKYANGAIDSFKVFKEIPKTKAVVYINPGNSSQTDNEIHLSYRRGTYQYQGHRISDRNVLFMAFEKNQIWKNKDIDLNITDSKRNKVLQYTIGYGGAAFGGVCLYASAIGGDLSSNSNDAAIAAFAGILSAGIVVSSQIVSFKYKLKRIKHADKVVELYNQLSKN